MKKITLKKLYLLYILNLSLLNHRLEEEEEEGEQEDSPLSLPKNKNN